MNMYTDFKDKLDIFQGVGGALLFFLCFLLFWIVKNEKSRQMKVLLVYCMTMIIAILNPVSLYVIDKSGNMDVFERLFWLLLMPFMTALSLSYLVGQKKVSVLVCTGLVLLCGKIVFTSTEYKPAENAEKISQTAIEVSDIIMRDYLNLPKDAKITPNQLLKQNGNIGAENQNSDSINQKKLPRAIITEPINGDVRAYNADIELWYVRKGFGNSKKKKYKKISTLFSWDTEEVPIKTVVKNMKKEGFDYFVTGPWQTLTGEVNRYPVKEIAEVNRYRIYKYTPPLEYTVTQFSDISDYQCMSYLIEASDGRICVVDGGRAWQSESLVEEIKKRGGIVSAWIITHAHDDHAGVLASVLAAEWDKKEIQIDQILVGDMDAQAALDQGIRTDMLGYLQAGLDRFQNENGQDSVKYLKTGDEMDVMGLHMKVLHTCDDYVALKSSNILNDGSMAFKLTASKTSMLFLADTADRSREYGMGQVEASKNWEQERNTALLKGSEMGEYLAKQITQQFPDDIKATYVQMSHHGNGSYPKWFYEAINPTVAFFDAPDWLMAGKDKETGEMSYYSTPCYVSLMKEMNVKIISYSSKQRSVVLN